MLFIFLQTLVKPLLCAERTEGLIMNTAAMRISTLTALLMAVSASEGQCETLGYPSLRRGRDPVLARGGAGPAPEVVISVQ